MVNPPLGANVPTTVGGGVGAVGSTSLSSKTSLKMSMQVSAAVSDLREAFAVAEASTPGFTGKIFAIDSDLGVASDLFVKKPIVRKLLTVLLLLFVLIVFHFILWSSSLTIFFPSSEILLAEILRHTLSLQPAIDPEEGITRLLGKDGLLALSSSPSHPTPGGRANVVGASAGAVGGAPGGNFRS